MKIKDIMPGNKLGEGITKFVTGMAAQATTLHELMVHSAGHAWAHGDTSYVERLCKEMLNNPDEKLKGAAITNVAGMRFWFSMFAPVMIKADGSCKLLDKNSEAYAKFLENAAQFGEPDEPQQNSGLRAFYVTAGEQHPFWNMKEVQQQQRTTIRPLGIKTIIGNVFKLETQLNKAVEDGLIPKDSIDKARELVANLTKQAREFRDANAGLILAEEEQIAKLREGQVETEKADASEDASNAGAPDEVLPDVAPGVEAGLKPNEQEIAESDTPAQGTGTTG